VAFPLEAGDVLVFYSDGVTEARNAEGEFFGIDRLIEVIGAQHQLGPEQLIDMIRRAIVAFSGAETCTDDLTCVAVRLADTGRELALAQARYEATSDTAELASMRVFVRRFCQALSVPVLDEDGLSQLELAVTEAASNIMKHAYHGRTDQRIQFVADAFADRIIIRLIHRGTAFNLATVRQPAFDGSREGGFGVYIIVHTVDEVRYVRDEQGNNCICLVKKRKTQ
jgi:sigma-B regulation protein RsbU (phosphoserine phosphatase)